PPVLNLTEPDRQLPQRTVAHKLQRFVAGRSLGYVPLAVQPCRVIPQDLGDTDECATQLEMFAGEPDPVRCPQLMVERSPGELLHQGGIDANRLTIRHGDTHDRPPITPRANF